MGYLKTKGIVIARVKVGDADAILTLLTAGNGVMQVNVKGAGRTRSHLSGASQLLTYGEFMIFTGKESNTLNGCEIIDSFANISKDIQKLTFAAHMCKIIRDVIQEGQTAVKTTKLLSYALYTLNTDRQPNDLAARCFEFRLLCLHGYMPEISSCLSCGKQKDNYIFSIQNNGIICIDCHSGPESLLLNSTLKVLQYIAAAEMKKVFSFHVHDDVAAQLNEIIPGYMHQALEREYHTLDFLDRL